MALIEREAFRRELLSLTYYGDGDYYIGREAERDAIIDHLNEQPTIDAAPVVHGRVLDNGNPICGPCSVCGESTNRRARYCSMCGARMGGEGDA